MAELQKEILFNQSYLGANWKEIVAKRMADVIASNGEATLKFGSFRVEMDGKWATLFDGSARIGAFYKGQVLGSEDDAIAVVKMLQVAFKTKVDGMWGKNTEKAYKKGGVAVQEERAKAPEEFTAAPENALWREAEYNRAFLGEDWKEKVQSSAENLVALFSPGSYSLGNYSVVMVGDKATLYENGSQVAVFTKGMELSDEDAVNMVKAVQVVVKAAVDGKWGKGTDRAYRNSRGRSGSVREGAPGTSEGEMQQAGSHSDSQFEARVDKFLSQIGDKSESARKFVSDCLKAYDNASGQGVISTHRFIMVNATTNQLYIFDMGEEKLWRKPTYAALGSGGIGIGNGSNGTPPGLSYLYGPNTGSRGGFKMRGAEEFNKNNDELDSEKPRYIRFHDRNGPNGNLNDKQRTTSGCVAVVSSLLKEMMDDDSFLKAGVFVWAEGISGNRQSQYVK